MEAAQGATDPSVDVVIVAYGQEPLLGHAVSSVLSDPNVAAVYIWDNGFEGTIPQDAAGRPIHVLGTGTNLGFSEGCDRAANAGSAPFIVFLNSDAVVEPGAIGAIIAPLRQEEIGLTTGLVTLFDQPDQVNAAGNPVHISLLSWAGGFGDDVSDHQTAIEPASVSGAFFAVSRQLWVELGGFWSEHFAYGEDVELSLRCLQSGRKVLLVPEAVARHNYEFSRNSLKLYLLERNRWINIFTLYDGKTLTVWSPILLLFEAGVIASALREKWLGKKLAAISWCIANRKKIAARRRAIRSSLPADHLNFVSKLEAEIHLSDRVEQSIPPWVNRLFGWYARRVAHHLPAYASLEQKKQPALREP